MGCAKQQRDDSFTPAAVAVQPQAPVPRFDASGVAGTSP